MLCLRQQGIAWREPAIVIDALHVWRQRWKKRVDSGCFGTPRIDTLVMDLLDPDRWPLRFASRPLTSRRVYDIQIHIADAAVAGIKGYVTNRLDLDGGQVIAAYHQLWHVEKAFRMSKHDLKARPIYHRKAESIDAHLTVVMAAMAVAHLIEQATGWSIKKFVRAARRYRTITIEIAGHTMSLPETPPDDVAEAITKIRDARDEH